MRRPVLLLVAAATVALVAGCGGDPSTLPRANHASAEHSTSASSRISSGATSTPSAEPAVKPVGLRAGERFLEIRMPAAYTPAIPERGTDDYRCFLLDPQLSKDSLITGTDFLPANEQLVHHVILYKLEAANLADAQKLDAAEPGEGWTCFGGTGVEGPGELLDEAPWLGGWAPGGRERVIAKGIGVPVSKDTRIIMQVHYNLTRGTGTDQSAVKLRITPDGGRHKYLKTMLLPAPVELPCREGRLGGMCSRAVSIADTRARFGVGAGSTGDLLHLLCGPSEPDPTQTCTRPVRRTMVVRAASGHMHLLGSAISVVANKGTPKETTLLDIPVWNFDDQGSVPLPKPVTVGPGDTLTVSCTHDQSLRDKLPAFEGTDERYVVWGEGTTDEMCLGIVSFTTD